MASFLETLKRNVKPGKIPGTLDFNLTERAGLGTGSQIPKNIVNKASDLAFSTLYKAPTKSYTAPTPTNNNYNGEIQGASTSDFGTGYGSAYSSSSSDTTGDLKTLAGDSKTSQIDAIKNRMSMIRDQVNRQADVARGVRDELFNNIDTTYGGLKQSAQQKVGTALENLAQERTGVYDTYGTAKGESRRALESAMLKNRMLARAMGRLNSSFYDDRQAEATETGSRNISGLAREEAGKVAGIGTRETETKNWGEQTGLQIEQEQAQLKSQADREYSQRVNEAMDMERAFGIDSQEDLEQAEIEYQSKLSGIQQYIENRAMRVAEIMANAGVLGSGINSFSAIDPDLQGILSNNTAYNRAQSTDIPTMSGITQGTNSMANINQGNPTAYLDELRKLYNLRNA